MRRSMAWLPSPQPHDDGPCGRERFLTGSDGRGDFLGLLASCMNDLPEKDDPEYPRRQAKRMSIRARAI